MLVSSLLSPALFISTDGAVSHVLCTYVLSAAQVRIQEFRKICLVRTWIVDMTACISSSDWTSHCSVSTESSLAPALTASRLKSSSLLALRAHATTFISAAASATAQARPIPAEAPVTIATFPASLSRHGVACSRGFACMRNKSLFVLADPRLPKLTMGNARYLILKYPVSSQTLACSQRD
jgi:hypothetical protein